MNLHEKWDENTILYYVEGDTDAEDNITYFTLSFGFYDCEYMATLSASDLLEDYGNVGLDGHTKLFDSFEELLNGTYWPKIKEVFERYKIWLAIPPEDWDWTKYKRVYWLEEFTDEDTKESFMLNRTRVEPIDYELTEIESLEKLPV